MIPILLSKPIILHLLPPAQPLDVFSLGVDGQIPIALTDGAVAAGDGDLTSGLRLERRMGDLETNRPTVAASCHGDQGQRIEGLLESLGAEIQGVC